MRNNNFNSINAVCVNICYVKVTVVFYSELSSSFTNKLREFVIFILTLARKQSFKHCYRNCPAKKRAIQKA